MPQPSAIEGRHILLTGGAGFLGQHVCHVLERFAPKLVTVPRSSTFDLRSAQAIERLLEQLAPIDVVIHLAAVVGGIGANRNNPGSFFYDNAMMGIQLMENARLAAVKKFVSVGTVCSYPKHTAVPFRETDLWNGYPEETNAPYGLAKKMLLVQGQAYRKQYGFNAIHLLPVNLYGPGDNFHPQDSHVIPALIRKVILARESRLDHIDVWGSGRPTREFLFVRDAAEGIALAAAYYSDDEPVNIGSNHEIGVRELAELICELCHYRGELRWDLRQPDGQPRRCVDTSRAREQFGFVAKTSLREGLMATIAYYEEHFDRIESHITDPSRSKPGLP